MRNDQGVVVLSAAPLKLISSAASSTKPWSAVGSMSMCVAMLIAAEFMPVSLLTPIANDLHGTQGTAGQAISISGLFALAASLLIPSVGSRFDRRHVLLALTGAMLVSLALIAEAPNFSMPMAARALLGVAIGGFWALATATIMKIMPAKQVSKALGVLYTGNAVATTFAAPVGSYLGTIIGWRGAFWALVPLVLVNLIWYSGAFAAFTYFRPFLENVTHVSPVQLSLLLLGLGLAGFAGTFGASSLVGTRLYGLIRWLPFAQGVVTGVMLWGGRALWLVAAAMMAWGALNAATPVAWSTWLSRDVGDEP